MINIFQNSIIYLLNDQSFFFERRRFDEGISCEKNKLSIFQEISTFTGQNINLLFEKIVKVLFLQIINCERNLDAELDTNSISGLDHSQRNNSNSFYLSSKSKKNHNSCSC